MAVVFVSHANADQALVDEFVDLILRNGCDLQPSEVFYSSGADTGVPDGQDLLAHVRSQVSETGLVVAMLTPTFQTRPVCVAELGAAWGHTGKLFPLLVPGMDRKELDGVLTTSFVEDMADEGALDRLHEKITEATGRAVKAPTWTRAKKRWLKRLAELVDAGAISVPKVVSVGDYEAVVAQRDELEGALANAEEEIERLRQELSAISALKDADEVAEVRLPAKPVKRFEALVEQAREHLDDLNDRIAQVIVAECSRIGGLPVPSDHDLERQQLFDLADKDFLLIDEGMVWASDAFPAHEDARAAVKGAIRAVPDDDPDFDEWFEREFDVYPRMSNFEVLRRVFLS